MQHRKPQQQQQSILRRRWRQVCRHWWLHWSDVTVMSPEAFGKLTASWKQPVVSSFYISEVWPETKHANTIQLSEQQRTVLQKLNQPCLWWKIELEMFLKMDYPQYSCFCDSGDTTGDKWVSLWCFLTIENWLTASQTLKKNDRNTTICFYINVFTLLIDWD